MFNDAATTGNRVQGNRIGRFAAAAPTLSNNYGVVVNTGATGNRVGGTEAGEGNAIAFNGFAGVALTASAGTGNAVLGNATDSNGALGVDLGDDGRTANDPGDADAGANRLQNFPDFDAATQTAGTLSVTYSLGTAPANATYPIRVEFFRADAGAQEGEVFLGADTYTAFDFAGGSKTANFPPALALVDGDRIVATATDAVGNTSEFSAAEAVEVVFTPATTTVAAVAMPNPVVIGRTVTFRISTTPDGGVFPTGSIFLVEGATLLATLPLDPAGTATFSTTTLALGDHAIRVIYGGSQTFAGSEAPVQFVTVRFARTDTWDGGGSDDLWTTAANWVGDEPVAAGDALVFPPWPPGRRTNDFHLARSSPASRSPGDYDHRQSDRVKRERSDLGLALKLTAWLDVWLTGAIHSDGEGGGATLQLTAR